MQVSASNISARILTPRILATDRTGDASITSLSYDYVNYQLLYSSSRGLVYQLGFNDTRPNKVRESGNKEIINSATSQSHLFTLERDSSRLELWRSHLTGLAHDPEKIISWDDPNYFEEFIVTADGKWLFFIDADTNQLCAVDISTPQTQTPTLLFSNLKNVRKIRFIPDTLDQLFNGELSNPCLYSRCSHLCLPTSSTDLTCSCPNGEKQRMQDEDCDSSHLEGSTVLATSEGIHVLRRENSDSLSLTLLPLSGYVPLLVGEVTAAEDRVYWSEQHVYHGIPYSLIRTGSVKTGFTSTLVSETLGRVSGLVVDRLSDNLFWSDSMLRRIEISRTNGQHRKVLYDNDVIQGPPSNLVADLVRSKLYWVEEVDGFCRILSADMDVDSSVSPQVLAENLTSVNSLAVDAGSSLLYWSGSEGINSLNITELVPTPILVFNAEAVTAIAVDNPTVLSLKSHNCTSLFSDTSLLLRYSSSLLGLAHIPDDRDRESACIRDTLRTCPHLCLPAYAGIQYSCVCSPGFQLKIIDGVSHCEEVEETLYMSQPGTIKVIHRNSIEIFSRKPELKTTSGTASSITGDVRRRHIYWSDTVEGVIGRIDEDGSNLKVIQGGFYSVHGLAFDPLSDNLYWSDNRSGVVGVSTSDGSLQKVLVHARDSIPLALASNPISSEIYFSTQSSPLSIRSMYGNAKNNREIIRTKGKAQAILFENNLNELVWARNLSALSQWKPTVLKCTLPDCSDDVLTFFDLDVNIYGLAASPDKFYSAGSLANFPNVYFLQQHYLPQGRFEQVVIVPTYRPGALYLSHISSQPRQHYCAINNGGCSHFCLLGRPSTGVAPQEYSCECPVHMRMSSDGRNCQLRETFLFVLTDHYILALNKYPYVVDEAVPVGTLQNPRFVSFDPIDNVIYWLSDASQNESVVKSYGLNKGEMKPSIVTSINHTDSVIFNFEVEWVGKYAFWTRSDGDSIEFTKLDSPHSGYIFHDPASKPRALAVDPVNSSIFFSDWSDPPSIHSISLDGKNDKVLVNSDYVCRPSSLIFSHKHNSLFWYDYAMHNIAQYNFETESVVFLDETLPLGELGRNVTESDFDQIKIAISGDELVWWEKRSQPMITKFHYFNLLTLSSGSTDVTSVGNIHDMIGHTVDKQIQHNSYPCRNHPCKGICSHNSEDFTCTCPLYTYNSSVTLNCEPFKCPFVSSCTPGTDCVDSDWRCDGIRNCMDGSDEANCTGACEADQILCNSTKICIPIEKRCNGDKDCLDGSDELNCMTPRSSLPSTSSTTSDELDVFEKSYFSILLALIMAIILLFIVCIGILIIWLICLHRPFYRGFQYKIKRNRKEDLEKNRSSPSYSESEIQSNNSSRPILDPPRKSGIIRQLPVPNTQFTNQSPDIQLHLDEHYNSAPLCFGYRSAPLSLDVPTVDLVSIVTDQSLNRSEYDYEKMSISRVPPPSVNTNNSSVFLSVSQQDIPAAVESGIPDGTTLITGSQRMIEYPHPNSEISTALTNTYFQQVRPPNHLSGQSSHFSTYISSLPPGSFNS